MTRRVTLVKYLRGENGFSAAQLKEAFAVPGTTEFLTRAQTLGIGNAELADRLVAFKTGGGSGLQNAIVAITKEFDSSKSASASDEVCVEALEDIQDALASLQAQVAAALGQA